MGVYIPNMEKPKDCYLCDFTNGYECWSNGEPWFDVKEVYAKRTLSPNCPIIDIVTCGGCSRRKKNGFCLEHNRYERNDDGFCSYGERRADGDI